ncbi:MAG: nucleotidyl transferase AbiEii/AbiGii toxin family protein [Bacteroidales bacterium]|nr:nucleotidyl transferase AbiEii/AbiGii toxin family protein [Candidatus Cacconaster equi]
MLYYETIHPDTLELLKKIQSLEIFTDTRLVGGTALALQIGHRKSIDLDFFGNVSASLEEIVLEFSEFANANPLSSSKTMRFLIVDGVKVDIVNYPYNWIDKPVIENGIILAGIKDISAMKLSAITNRGTKKDFIDLYFLLKRFSFNELIDFYLEKYSDAQLFTMLKSLTYFEDAEADPLPVMVDSISWDEAKASIVMAVNQYLNRKL